MQTQNSIIPAKVDKKTQISAYFRTIKKLYTNNLTITKPINSQHLKITNN